MKTLERRSETNDNASMVTNLLKLLQDWKAVIETLKARVTVLEEVSIGKVNGGSASTDLARDPFALLGISNPPADSLMMDTDTVEPPVTPSDLGHLVDDIHSRIKKLEKVNSDKGKAGLSGAVRFAGHTFTNKEDVQAWLDEHLEVGMAPYGLFADPQLLLHWIWIVIGGHHTNATRDLKDRLSVEMSQAMTFAMDSYQHLVPLVFTGKKYTIMNTGGLEKSRLALIPTFSSWDDTAGDSGLKQQMAEAIIYVKDSMSELIQEGFDESPEVRAFAMSMLHSSVSFIENLSTYMSDTFKNFKDVMGTEKTVWGLVTYVVEQIFRKDFGQARSKTIGALDAKNKQSALKMVWSSIRCVGVAEDMVKHGIKNAPAVSANYVRFIITHSNVGKITSIMDENKNLKRRVTDLEDNLETVKRIADGAKKVADQAMSKASKKKRASDSEDEYPLGIQLVKMEVQLY